MNKLKYLKLFENFEKEQTDWKDPFKDLNQNKIWKTIKGTLDDTSVSDYDKSKLINKYKGNKEIYDMIINYQDHLTSLSKGIDDFNKNKEANVKLGREFEKQISEGGIELKWMGDNYEIYFPKNELDKQIIIIGSTPEDLEFGKFVFKKIEQYEKNGNGQEEIYDILIIMLPTMKSSFKKQSQMVY